MGIISLPSYGSDPATVNASNLDGKVDPLATEFNGGIDNDNIDASAAIAASKLNLATIAQVMAMSSKIFKLAKGADVASAAGAITLGEDGNYFDITGTAAITSITAKAAGTVVVLQFDSTASLVDGSNLKLGGNFQGATESQIMLVSDGTNWFEVSRQPSTVLTTQGDTPYHNGTTETRLAAGTSGQFLKTLGAGANPAWAFAFAQNKVISTTRDISLTTQLAITGVGFTPKMVFAFWNVDTEARWGVGWADSAKTGAAFFMGSNTATRATAALLSFCTTNAAFNDVTVTSYDSDGITLDFAKTGSPTGTANLKFIFIG